MLDKSYTFEYNVGGNIISKNEYAYTEELVLGTPTKIYAYTYGNGWKDQLSSFDGSTITYDIVGNPTSYLGVALTWTRGRLLHTYSKGRTLYTMNYNARGVRTSKIKETPSFNGINLETTSYTYDSEGRLRRETRNAFERIYLYSSDGIIGYEEDGEKFLYRKNLFGDIIAIYKGTEKVAEYVYDAWGNCTIITNVNGYGTRNPFRYRGYYFDTDLNMYYLMTRYYDPQTGRFINADNLNYLEPFKINGLNLYAYCVNNPIMNIDPMGTQFCQTSFDGEYDLDDDMYNSGGGGGGGAYYGYGSAYYTYTVRTNTATHDAQLGGYHVSGNTGATLNPGYFIVPGAVTVNDSMVVRTTSVYRSIGEAEARDISTTGKFNISQRGMDCKQFGFNYDETCQFGDKMGQSIIVSAQLPTDSLDYFYNVGVDSAIFKHGTLTVYKEDLGLFNYLTRGTIVITYR